MGSFHPSQVLGNVKRNFSRLGSLALGIFTILLPYYIYRNPLHSSYFSEPTGRKYDLNMVWVYLVSLIFVFGFTSAFFFIGRNYKHLCDLLQKNLVFSTFLFLELALILLWPAAIPRLFVAVIPFLIILLALSVEDFFYVAIGTDVSGV